MNTREAGRLVICVRVTYYLTLPLQRADRVEISPPVLLVLFSVKVNTNLAEWERILYYLDDSCNCV